MGGVIFKAILNLLAKAITSPFALLSGGSSNELSAVEFEPGQANIKDSALSNMDKVAKILTDKPQLKVTLTGTFDPQTESDAFALDSIHQKLKTMRKRAAHTEIEEAAPTASSPQSLTQNIQPNEQEKIKLLRQLYSNTKLPHKPRNAIGLAKDLSEEQMLDLLKANVNVTPEAMQALAQQRAITVRDALIAKGLPSERIYLAPPKVQKLQGSSDKIGVNLQVGAD
jgi:hypothetical protein